MGTHTKGPWELIGAQGTAIWAGDKIIASMSETRSNHAQARIDARLIAAAPDLLEAAESVLAAHNAGANPEDALAELRAAIAKTTQP